MYGCVNDCWCVHSCSSMCVVIDVAVVIWFFGGFLIMNVMVHVVDVMFVKVVVVNVCFVAVCFVVLIVILCVCYTCVWFANVVVLCCGCDVVCGGATCFGCECVPQFVFDFCSVYSCSF